jgi:hypothetical protein
MLGFLTNMDPLNFECMQKCSQKSSIKEENIQYSDIKKKRQIVNCTEKVLYKIKNKEQIKIITLYLLLFVVLLFMYNQT